MQRHVFTSQRVRSIGGIGRFRKKFKSSKPGGRSIYGVLFAVALFLFGFDQVGHELAEDARGFATDLSLPLLETTSGAISAVRVALKSTRDYADLAREFEVIRAENRNLKSKASEARIVEARARAYESLLNYVPEDGSETIAARTIADMKSPFAQSVIVNAGRERGVANGQAVLGETGLVGRIISTGQKTSRVLLLTDINSRVPVFVGQPRYRAILAGTNGGNLAMMHLPSSAVLAGGETVMTSGEGRLLPEGITIGTVNMNSRGEPDVRLARAPRESEVLRILTYSPNIDIDLDETPLPVALMDDAELARSDTRSAGPGAIRAAVAIKTGPGTQPPIE